MLDTSFPSGSDGRLNRTKHVQSFWNGTIHCCELYQSVEADSSGIWSGQEVLPCEPLEPFPAWRIIQKPSAHTLETLLTAVFVYCTISKYTKAPVREGWKPSSHMNLLWTDTGPGKYLISSTQMNVGDRTYLKFQGTQICRSWMQKALQHRGSSWLLC